MEERKKQILDSAIKFFSEKGYFHTSMQDIAADCGMSKGSLYNVFDSKEDLLIQLFEYNHKKMLQRASLIQLDDSLSQKEMVKQLIVVELEGALENKNFFNIIYTSFPENKNKKTLALMKKTRAEMVYWHKHTLLRIYGKKVEKGIWDLVITYQGMIKEFIFLINKEEKQVDFNQAAAYIADVMDTVVQHLPVRQPVLDTELMKEYETFSKKEVIMTRKEQQKACFQTLQTAIRNGNFQQEKKQKLIASVDMLEEEMEQAQPRGFLIDALFSYLNEEEQVKKEIKELKFLL